ncbi:MAG: 4Fe-4S binding protein, partial [Desulfopila sp.]|nr:4Fe-4S binding protein [Desulfopila sp.]
MSANHQRLTRERKFSTIKPQDLIIMTLYCKISYEPLHKNPKALSYERTNTKRKGMAKKKLKELVINRDWCKSCGICVKYCPTQV